MAPVLTGGRVLTLCPLTQTQINSAILVFGVQDRNEVSYFPTFFFPCFRLPTNKDKGSIMMLCSQFVTVCILGGPANEI